MKKYVPAAAGASNVALNASSDVRAPSVLSMASTPVGRATRSPGTAYRTLPGSACRRAASTSPSHGRKEADTGSVVASGARGEPTRTYFGPAAIDGSLPTTASVSASGTPRGTSG